MAKYPMNGRTHLPAQKRSLLRKQLAALWIQGNYPEVWQQIRQIAEQEYPKVRPVNPIISDKTLELFMQLPVTKHK